MLEVAIASWVDSLDERELDVPLRALLRAEGFYDIELVHGVSEHGRDFIAKRDDVDGARRQYSIQSKAGNLGISEWRGVREQLEDIRTVPLQHPRYDRDLEPRMMLVTSGTLVGDARAASAGYESTLPAPWRLELWTGARIVELLGLHLEAALTVQARGPLLSLLGSIDEGKVDHRAIERHSRRWVPTPGEPVSPVHILEAGLIAHRLKGADRLDLACVTAMATIRAQMVAASGVEPPADLATDVRSAGAFFATYAEEIWSRCEDQLLEPPPMVNAHQEFGFWVTYPVRCLRLAELLGLLGLWRRRADANSYAITEWLKKFVIQQPGAAHPVSERFAVSLLPPALLLSSEQEILTTWLRKVVKWTADRYDGASIGLAGIDSGPLREVEYLLGDMEHIEHERRRESMIAGAVLDLASGFELAELYDVARHEFLAVDVIPDVRQAPAGADGWLRQGQGLRQELNPPYPESYGAAQWPLAPHQQGDEQATWAIAAGLEWEALAVWCLLRDRFSAVLLRDLAT